MSGDRGISIVEAPLAVIVLVTIGFGAFWLGNLALRYHQLEEAVHAGARYGTRAYFAPGGGPERRRSATEIAGFTAAAADPVAGVTIELRCAATIAGLDSAAPCTAPDIQPAGSFIQVQASAVVAQDDPALAIARSVNSLLGAIGVGAPFSTNVTVTDAAVAIVE